MTTVLTQLTMFRSASCDGEVCTLCGADADAKVEEAIMHDDPQPSRHPLTAYVCARHFAYLTHPSEVRCKVMEEAMGAMAERDRVVGYLRSVAKQYELGDMVEQCEFTAEAWEKAANAIENGRHAR